MVNLDIYAIYIETSENRGEIVALYNTFDECIKHRMEFANWFRPNGDIWIHHIPGGNNFVKDKSWHIDSDGNIIQYR